jgi:hypothetical protein
MGLRPDPQLVRLFVIAVLMLAVTGWLISWIGHTSVHWPGVILAILVLHRMVFRGRYR